MPSTPTALPSVYCLTWVVDDGLLAQPFFQGGTPRPVSLVIGDCGTRTAVKLQERILPGFAGPSV
ncbi:hypothetical protein [Telmatospirillum sp.]|uniref:hypothetical protein n=1 Tax=Telmatospirillum sp. TaxID=2079197 RepID=UPI002840FCB7|nr:hypothetical protein [Telmatospirillum sp.]MDR3437657.1 hypothetical protein [Telmatospirillum sp.]